MKDLEIISKNPKLREFLDDLKKIVNISDLKHSFDNLQDIDEASLKKIITFIEYIFKISKKKSIFETFSEVINRSSIYDEENQKKIRNLNKKILKASFEEKINVKEFLQTIVEYGANMIGAKSCVIFLLEESDNLEINKQCGEILRLYASSPESEDSVGSALKKSKAEYYIPPKSREVFKEEKMGRNKVNEFLKKYFKLIEKKDNNWINSQQKDLVDVLREDFNSSLMQAIKKLQKIDKEKYNLKDLVDKGILPMGITAYVFREGICVMLDRLDVRDHFEWRGSYEGEHEICTSIIEAPLRDYKGRVIGVVKIENHNKNIEKITKIKDLIEKKDSIKIFDDKDKYMLNILADSAMIAINEVLTTKDTYKKIVGTQMEKKIEELKYTLDLGQKVNKKCLNYEIINEIFKFYKPLKIFIEDINKLESIQERIENLIRKIITKLKLPDIKEILAKIGPRFENLLGTEYHYREHFIHQYLVFLLGFYIINKNKNFKDILVEHLKSKNKELGFDDVLTVWFLTSMFHDSWKSVEKLKIWLPKYFENVKISNINNVIPWQEMLLERSYELSNIVNMIKNLCISEKKKNMKFLERFAKLL